jgi:hypothetical protein
MPGFSLGRPDRRTQSIHPPTNGHHRLASAFRTSDCDKPNCRAICDGLMPALKTARTAFIFPGIK